ncbi:hypothetical protein Hanom_Chr15g01383161 [Helianthus anomalus]
MPIMCVTTPSSSCMGASFRRLTSGVPSFLKLRSSPWKSMPSSRHLLISETQTGSTNGCRLWVLESLYCKKRLRTNISKSRT